MPDNVATCFKCTIVQLKTSTKSAFNIGAVLVPGSKAPKLITRNLSSMQKGAVLIDVAVDQGVVLKRLAQPLTKTLRM